MKKFLSIESFNINSTQASVLEQNVSLQNHINEKSDNWVSAIPPIAFDSLIQSLAYEYHWHRESKLWMFFVALL